ncbi:hypothetical protein PG984_005441 [Apiospora sp. TS-2023a]
MAHPGFSAAPPPHYHYPQSVPAPQQQDIASRMALTYHQLGQLDPGRRFPLDLVHILVKAASRDPAIALEVDYAMQRQFNQPPPVGHQPTQMMGSQMGPPMTAPLGGPNNIQRGPIRIPRQQPATLGMPSSASVVPPSVPAPSPATVSSSSAAAVNQVPAATGRKRKRKRAAASENAAPPPRSSRIGTKEWWASAKEDDAWMARMGMGLEIRRFIRRNDNPSEEEVDRRFARAVAKKHQSYTDRLRTLFTVTREIYHALHPAAPRLRRVPRPLDGPQLGRRRHGDRQIIGRGGGAMTPDQRRKVQARAGDARG